MCDTMDCSPPGFSVHGISQARKLEWAVISFSRGCSRPRDHIHVSCTSRWILYHWAARKAQLCTTQWGVNKIRLPRWHLEQSPTEAPWDWGQLGKFWIWIVGAWGVINIFICVLRKTHALYWIEVSIFPVEWLLRHRHWERPEMQALRKTNEKLPITPERIHGEPAALLRKWTYWFDVLCEEKTQFPLLPPLPGEHLSPRNDLAQDKQELTALIGL